MTRAEIQNKIQDLVKTLKTKEEVEIAIEKWLKKEKVSDFDTKQIMNDMTGYKEYNELER